MESNNKHSHRFVIIGEGNRSELICECGRQAYTTYKGAVWVSDELEEGIGTE